MRITLDLDDKLLAAARRRARARGMSLSAVIQEALAAALTLRSETRARFRLRWKPHRGRVLPGVDVAVRESLYDIMEGRR